MSANLIAKIHRVRLGGLTIIKQGKTNLGRFAAYPDVWSTLQPSLSVEGLSVGFSAARITFHGEAELVSMDMEISDGADCVTWPYEMIVPEKVLTAGGKPVTNNAQRVASAESYLRRTALIHAFGMSAGNEDEVERMTPAEDLSNLPGAIAVTADTKWQDLVEGLWENAQSPLYDGTLVGYAAQGDNVMRGMWRDYPDHAGLQAWAADWIVSTLQALGIGWDGVRAGDADLPAYLTQCTGSALRRAAKALAAALAKAKEETA